MMKNNKKSENIVKNNQIFTFSLDEVEIPAFVEKQISGKNWVNWGDKNQLPYYLYDLFTKSSLMQSIINTTVDFIIGNGIESSYLPNDDEKWEDLIKNLALDYMLYRGFAVQIMYNKLGNIKELNWLDMRKCRTDEEHRKVFYSKEFGERKSNPAYIEFPIWTKDQEYRNCSVVYFYTGSKRTVYPLPMYSGSIAAIETSIRIDNFHLNAIKNNFSNNTIISFNNGVPTDDIKHEIEKKIKDKFCGDSNAGKIILTWNDSKDNDVEIHKLEDDNFDKKYEALKSQTITSIFTGFSAPSQLFGYAISGNVFSKQEYQEAFDLYNRLKITPIQDLFTRVFDKIFNTVNSIVFKPYELSTDDNDDSETITKINEPESNE